MKSKQKKGETNNTETRNKYKKRLTKMGMSLSPTNHPTKYYQKLYEDTEKKIHKITREGTSFAKEDYIKKKRRRSKQKNENLFEIKEVDSYAEESEENYNTKNTKNNNNDNNNKGGEDIIINYEQNIIPDNQNESSNICNKIESDAYIDNFIHFRVVKNRTNKQSDNIDYNNDINNVEYDSDLNPACEFQSVPIQNQIDNNLNQIPVNTQNQNYDDNQNNNNINYATLEEDIVNNQQFEPNNQISNISNNNIDPAALSFKHNAIEDECFEELPDNNQMYPKTVQLRNTRKNSMEQPNSNPMRKKTYTYNIDNQIIEKPIKQRSNSFQEKIRPNYENMPTPEDMKKMKIEPRKIEPTILNISQSALISQSKEIKKEIQEGFKNIWKFIEDNMNIKTNDKELKQCLIFLGVIVLFSFMYYSITNGSLSEGIIELQSPNFYKVFIPLCLIGIAAIVYYNYKEAKKEELKYFRRIAEQDFESLKMLLKRKKYNPNENLGNYKANVYGVAAKVFVEESATKNNMSLIDYSINVLPYLREFIIKCGHINIEEQFIGCENNEIWRLV